tara:strand:- start:90 stop:227 length:138 start_codon:yes stop_codon:yes gene_type:complete
MKSKKNKKKETIEETLKRLNLDTEPEYSINLFNLKLNFPIDKKEE